VLEDSFIDKTAEKIRCVKIRLKTILLYLCLQKDNDIVFILF